MPLGSLARPRAPGTVLTKLSGGEACTERVSRQSHVILHTQVYNPRIIHPRIFRPRPSGQHTLQYDLGYAASRKFSLDFCAQHVRDASAIHPEHGIVDVLENVGPDLKWQVRAVGLGVFKFLSEPLAMTSAFLVTSGTRGSIATIGEEEQWMRERGQQEYLYTPQPSASRTLHA
jgi:hypothetical protein